MEQTEDALAVTDAIFSDIAALKTQLSEDRYTPRGLVNEKQDAISIQKDFQEIESLPSNFITASYEPLRSLNKIKFIADRALLRALPKNSSYGGIAVEYPSQFLYNGSQQTRDR